MRAVLKELLLAQCRQLITLGELPEPEKPNSPIINPKPYYPASDYPNDKGNKRMLILGIVFISIVFIIGLISIMAFYNKDFSNFISIDNKAPDVPVDINTTNNYNNTNAFTNNVTIILDGEIAKMIANQTACEVKKSLNLTC